MPEPPRTTLTPDGRQIAFAIWGDPDGFPIFSLHVTPGSWFDRWPKEELYRSLGICLVTHDRAGYGQSTRRAGRRVVDEADDVRHLADHLGSEPEREIAENVAWLRDGIPPPGSGAAVDS